MSQFYKWSFLYFINKTPHRVAHASFSPLLQTKWRKCPSISLCTFLLVNFPNFRTANFFSSELQYLHYNSFFEKTLQYNSFVRKFNTISCESKSNAYYSNLACLKIAQNQSYTSVDTNSLHIKKLMSFIKDLKFSNLMGTDCITITLMIHFFIKKNNNDSFKKDPHTKHRHLDVWW